MTSIGGKGATIGQILQTVFPAGTQVLDAQSLGEIANSDGETGPWETIPVFPYDVFAFCAHLIQITGLMGYFEPNPMADSKFGLNDDGLIQPLKVVLDRDKRKECKEASEEWRQNGSPNKYAISLWKVIHTARPYFIRIKEYQKVHADVFMLDPAEPKRAAPAWWQAVFELLIIADEACEGIGHFVTNDKETGNTAFEKMASIRIQKSRFSEGDKAVKSGPFSMVRARNQVSTLASAADRAVICVQPKARVAEIGCTLRSISRNLSITGPVGAVRCNWQQLAGKPRGGRGESLDILLVPLPHEFSALSFKAAKGSEEASRWGNFSVSQDWAQSKVDCDALCEMVRSLIKEALKDVKNINAIIFPEYALTFDLFSRLMAEVSMATDRSIEFMIAGSSDNCEGEKCNCVLTAIWEDRLADLPEGDNENRVRLVSQKKHHRWRLDKGQIATYGLASSLRPSIKWWEEHSIEQRELNFFQFRKDAVFASLICEDLARNDPCHEILRSIAPNLVFSLLMDGPQLATRWPARYASTLADDPGCTVLTFTSYGLIGRSNENSGFPASHSVGLLRDSNGDTKEIALPPGKNGVLLTLGSEAATDYTIDGRHTQNASSWHFISQKAIGG
ncbi:MAG: hypothetical protein ABJ327_20845 [Litoreibacter sp.]